MRLKLQLPAKAGRFHIFECEAVRLVTLPDEEFQDFLNGPHQDGRWAAEPFYADEHGRRIYQGVLVLGEGHKDGVFAYDGGKHFLKPLFIGNDEWISLRKCGIVLLHGQPTGA